MTGIEEAALIAAVAGTVVSAVGQVQAGNAARASANFESDQMTQQASAERATAQRSAYEKRREGRIAASRAKAIAAGGGGGAADPTVVNILGDIETQSDYNAMSAMFNGEDRAIGLETGSKVRKYEGAQARQAGIMGATSTVLSGASSMLTKYATPETLPWQEKGNVNPRGGYY